LTSTPDPVSVPATETRAGLFGRFLRFGFLAWGGPVAQVAMLRRELVDDERWISSSRFNRLLAVYQVLPGPEASELAVHMGMLRGGRLGGLLAGLGFILPGFVLMVVLSWLYFQIDLTSPALSAAFLGIQVAVIALIVRAVHRIGSHVLLSPILWLIGILAGAATFAGVSFWAVLPVSGLVYAVAARYDHQWRQPIVAAALGLAAVATAVAVVVWLAAPGVSIAPPTVGSVPVTPSIADLFLSGLKSGLLTFGGAYTVIPFLRGDAVGQGWLTDQQFLDGLALGGILPAPLIIFSTFVGYVGGGLVGALAMTIGIFLPAFGFSLLFGDQLEAVVQNETLHGFLEGVAAGVVGLIAVTTVQLALTVADAVPSLVPAVLIFCVALLFLFVSKARTAVVWVIAGSALAGFVAFQLLS
jgi:chromate transporter